MMEHEDRAQEQRAESERLRRTVAELAEAHAEADRRCQALRQVVRDLRAEREDAPPTQVPTDRATEVADLLTVIHGRADLLAQAVHRQEVLAAHAGAVVQAAEALADLLFPTAESRPASVFSVHDVILGLLADDVPALPPTLTVSTDLAATDDDVRGHAAALRQALVELLANASQAQGEDGTATLATANVDRAPDIPDAAPGGYLALRVGDDGPGLAAELRDRACEPFVTSRDGDGAAGLGLTVAEATARRLGGTLTVDGEPGQGCTVTLYLPVAAEPPTAPLPTAKTILVVEDETGVREYIANALDAHGYEVLSAANAAEAIVLSQSRRGRVDLLVTDVVMPRVNGFELARDLVASRPDLRVLYVSAYYDEEVVRTDSHVAGGFLAKPFRLQPLLRAIGDALA